MAVATTEEEASRREEILDQFLGDDDFPIEWTLRARAASSSGSSTISTARTR